MYFGHFDWKQIVFASVVSLSLAILSWKYVETPLRRTTFLRQRRRLFSSAFALSGAAIAVSLLIIGSNGCDWRFPDNISLLQDDAEWAGYEYVSGFDNDHQFRRSALASLGVDKIVRGKRLDFVVWGDSFGMALCDIINTVASDHGLHGKAIVRSSFLPIPNVCVIPSHEPRKYRRDVRQRYNTMEFLSKARPRNLILVAAWSWYADTPNISLVDTRSNSETGSASETINRNLRNLNSFCMNRGITLWIVKEVPLTGESHPATTLVRYVAGRTSSLSNQRRTKADHDDKTTLVEEIFDVLKEEHVRFIDPAPLLFDDNQMTINYMEGRSVYRDKSHLTRWGGQCVRPVFEEMFDEILRQSPANTNLIKGH
ncbi:MAG: SGNH hydrolase domain-containing protein [Rubripirellula sp.]|nr:SGNH hydrolase domain-containing protein [Rubripirellula sp.]